MQPPTASDTTRESMSLVDRPDNNTPGYSPTIPRGGYGFLEALLNELKEYSGTLVEDLEGTHRARGRKGYPAQGMICAFILQFLLNERFNSYFLRRLDNGPRLLAMCGLKKPPSEPTYCRFKRKMTGRLNELRHIFNRAARDLAVEIDLLRESGVISPDAPPLGYMLALDPTDIEAYARPRSEHCDDPAAGQCTKHHRRHCNNPDRKRCTRHSSKPCSDPNARWGYRTPKGKSGSATTGRDGEERKEWFFGYKAHVVADPYYGVPLHQALRPANDNENPKFREELDSTLSRHPWLTTKVVMGDKGYDSLENFKHTVDLGMVPIIAVRQPQEDKDTGKRLFDGTYDENGRPLCIGGEPMTWLGTDPDGAHHFRCPSQGCMLKDKIDWSRYCDSEHSEKPEGRLLRVMGIVPRFSETWKELYKKRSGIERWFSSAKRSRLMNSHQHLQMQKVELHVEVSMLASLLTTLTHLKAGDYEHARHMTIKLSNTPRSSVGTRCLD